MQSTGSGRPSRPRGVTVGLCDNLIVASETLVARSQPVKAPDAVKSSSIDNRRPIRASLNPDSTTPSSRCPTLAIVGRTSYFAALRAATFARICRAEDGFPRPTLSRTGCGLLDDWRADVDPAGPGSTSLGAWSCAPATAWKRSATAFSPWWPRRLSAGRACKPRAIPTGTDRAITVILGGLSEHDKRRRGAWGRLPKLDSQPPQCHCAEGQLTAISKRIDSRNRDRRATAVAPVALIPFRRAPP